MLKLLRRLRDDYRDVLATEAGRRVLADLVIHSGMNRSSAALARDGSALAYKAGARDLVLRAMSMARITDEELIEMERAERAERARIENEGA